MSLRNDIWFVTRVFGKALRQILGETLRTLADYLLHEEEIIPTPEPINIQPEPSTPVRTPAPRTKVKSRARTEVISNSPPEVIPDLEKPAKTRDRSRYNPKDHNGYKIAAIAVLKTLLCTEDRLSVPALHKLYRDITDSTIRTACKTMVEDGILTTELDSKVNASVFWILNHDAARKHLAELEAVAPVLPTSNELGESETSLN
jgi:hypothetical protein